MSSPPRVFTYFALLIALVILPQCSEKGSKDYVEEGIQFTNDQQYDKAVESFLNAIQKNPKNPKAYYGLGGIYNYKKMFPDAERAFKTAIQSDPTYHNAYYSLGFTYEMMGRKEEAQENYRKYRDMKKRFDALVRKEMENR